MNNIKKPLLFVVLVVVPILLIDYYVDSYASFRLTYKEIGKISSFSNYCVGADIPLSERKAKWAKLLYLTPVEYMVIGSSRSMQFSSDNLEKDSFYNLGVSAGSSVQDYMAEIYILNQLDKLPKYLLIEISPPIFNANSGESGYIHWENSYENMKKVLSGESVDIDESNSLGLQFDDILSPAYFKYNMEQLFEGKRSYIIKSNEYDNETLPTQHVDGSYAYSREYQTKYNGQAIANRIQNICDNKKVYCCSNYEELDMGLICEFNKLISYLESRDINIAFYLPPYEESMYKYINSHDYYHSIPKVEEYILQYADEHNLQVYGSYNPEKSNLSINDFYDEYHLKTYKVKDTLWPRYNNRANIWNE